MITNDHGLNIEQYTESLLAGAGDFNEIAIGVVDKDVAGTIVWAHPRSRSNVYALVIERGDHAIKIGYFKSDVTTRRTHVFFGDEQMYFDVATLIPRTSKIVVRASDGCEPQKLFIKRR